MLTMHFLPDQPVLTLEDDALGFTAFADQLHGAILGARSPFVFGVLGDWGTGKTSILRLLEARLNGEGTTTVPIWFDAWRYENETNILYPLLHAIRKCHTQKIAKPKDDRFGRAFLDAVVTSAFVLSDLGLRGATKALTGDAVKLEDLTGWLKHIREQKQPIADALGGWTDEVERLHQAFADLLAAFAADVRPDDPGSVRFVILIDDLDRCLPDTTIKLLESIKNHLDAPNVVFVLALNAAVVYQGIRHKYSGIDVNGREYLEKILNYTFYVPEPSMDNLKAFAGARMSAILPDPAERARLKTQLDEFGRVLSDCRFSNPRKIKRILNRYLLFLNKVQAEIGKFRLDSIIRLLVLAEYFPDVFQIVRDFIERKEARAAFEAAKFFDFYHERTGDYLFNRYPQLAIMSEMFNLRETANIQDNTLRQHAAEVYQITRLI